MQHQCNMHGTEPISEQHSKLEGSCLAGRKTHSPLANSTTCCAGTTHSNHMHMFLSSDPSTNRGSPCTGNHHLGNLLGGTPAKHTGHKPNLLTHQLVCFEACRRSKAAGAVPVCRAQETRLSRVCSRAHRQLHQAKGVCSQPCVMAAATPPTDTLASCSTKHRSAGVNKPLKGHESPSVLGPTQGVCTQTRHALTNSGVAGVQQGHSQVGAGGKTKRPLPACCARKQQQLCMCPGAWKPTGRPSHPGVVCGRSRWGKNGREMGVKEYAAVRASQGSQNRCK